MHGSRGEGRAATLEPYPTSPHRPNQARGFQPTPYNNHVSCYDKGLRQTALNHHHHHVHRRPCHVGRLHHHLSYEIGDFFPCRIS